MNSATRNLIGQPSNRPPRPRLKCIGLLAALCLWAAPSPAAWTPADLDLLTQNFTARISGSFKSTAYTFGFLDPEKCFAPGVRCYGINPDSANGYPAFGSAVVSGTRLKPTDAIVLIMETPPPMRYFGVTPYLLSRYYDSLPSDPSQAGRVTVFESLTDTVNARNIATTGSAAAGSAPFSQLSVFVVTADASTYSEVAKQLRSLGFPATAVNLVALPINAVPLKMGVASTSDSFTVLARLAYPESKAAMDDYLARAPVRTLKLSPQVARSVSPLPSPVSKIPGNGFMEAPELLAARDQLVDQLVSEYKRSHSTSENNVALVQTTNYWCIENGLPCNSDNPDALYGTDIGRFTPRSRADKILVVGIDHVVTGEASYVSHAVFNVANQVGVIAADDLWLKGSGLVMGKVTGPEDPRYPTLSQLYAFTISYDCSGEPVCLQIPEPTADDPVGVPFGDAFGVTARYYLDPATTTRPSVDEVIRHRVFKLLKRK